MWSAVQNTATHLEIAKSVWLAATAVGAAEAQPSDARLCQCAAVPAHAVGHDVQHDPWLAYAGFDDSAVSGSAQYVDPRYWRIGSRHVFVQRI